MAARSMAVSVKTLGAMATTRARSIMAISQPSARILAPAGVASSRVT
jgi:hypothetical protein